MSETLIVNTDAPTATDVENLTPDEQDSLAVGEEMVNQQEELLAGKYKNAEELEKAYGELERKLGEQGNKDSEAVSETEVPETEEVSEEKEETTETLTEYLEDGNVNYNYVNEQYGDKLGDLFKDNNIDPWSISEHFRNNEGTITDDMYGQLESAGLSRGAVDAYLQGRAADLGLTTTTDITDSTVAEIKSAAGGEESYNTMVQWASNNLDPKSIEAFDTIINTGSIESIKFAVSGLKAQYENANGYEGKMVTGKPPKEIPQDVYRSQAELVRAMSDPKYDADPAYRQDVIAKLERSDNLTF